jgi:hypothetical protein
MTKKGVGLKQYKAGQKWQTLRTKDKKVLAAKKVASDNK